MSILFLHPNFPGQFRRLAGALAKRAEISVYGLGDRSWTENLTPLQGVHTLTYEPPEANATQAACHPWVKGFDAAVHRGQRVIETLAKHKSQGLEPDVIVAHPGWGDAFFVRDFFPGARVIGLFEYFYRPRGADVGFDPTFPVSMDDIFRLHTSNATQLLALESCDTGICPTPWQKSLFPGAYSNRLQVLHEGVDTNQAKPSVSASYTLPTGQTLHAGDEVLTYVSRHLEPYRGFHILMRALPAVLKERPQCQVVIVGGETGGGYGPKPPPPFVSWKEKALRELGTEVDISRVHFVGQLPYDQYLRVLQVSKLHVYLTYPFILSWSALEAMACGCSILASDTQPVTDAMVHEHNAILFPFHSHQALSEHAVHMLANPAEYADLGRNARQTICDNFDFETISLPAYRKLLEL